MERPWWLLLLGLTWLTTVQAISDQHRFDLHPRSATACEGSTLTIQCPPSTRIRILKAIYGRMDPVPCNDGSQDISSWTMNCMSTKSVRIVSDSHLHPLQVENCVNESRVVVDEDDNGKFRLERVEDMGRGSEHNFRCDNQTLCSVHVTNNKFGDPCRDTPKYLKVEFTCPPATLPPTTIPTTTPTTTTTTTTQPTTTKPPTTTEGTTTSTRGTTTIDRPDSVQRYCEGVIRRDIVWPDTKSGQVKSMTCPNTKQEGAFWRCDALGEWVDEPDLSNCVSNEVLMLEDQLRVATATDNVDKVKQVATEVNNIVHRENLYGGDLAKLTEIVNDIVDEIVIAPVEISTETVETVNEAVVNTSSDLLSDLYHDAWTDLPQSEQAEAATNVLDAVEDSAFCVAEKYNEPKTVTTITINIVIQVDVVDTKGETVADISFPRRTDEKQAASWGGGNTIRLPGKAVKDLTEDGLAKIVFTTYRNIEEFLSPEVADEPISKADIQADKTIIKGPVEEKDTNKEAFDEGIDPEEQNKKDVSRVVNTNIISAAINGRSEEKVELSEPILYTLEHLQTENVFNPTCSFWEYSEKTMAGKWSSVGCKVAETNKTHTVCACTHLTNFAVLMDVSGTPLADHHEFALAMITYAGCIISIMCLILCWLTFTFFKNLQCDRNTIHKNLVFCLCIAEIIFLAGIMQYHRPVLCSVIAGFLHYFFLAAFCWMCMEGVQLYMMLIEVFEAERSRRKYYYLAAYGIPAIIVGITAAVNHEGYGTNSHCWLAVEGGIIWAFVGPVILIITINIVMLSIAIMKLREQAKSVASWKVRDKSKLKNIRSWIKGAVVLVALLGLTWAFGLLYIDQHTIAMAYIFTILNTLQGVFIFIFECLLNEKVQKEYKRRVRHTSWLPDCIRVNYGGAKAYATTSPNQSTSSGNYISKLLSNRRRKRSSMTSLAKSSSNASRWTDSHAQQELLNNAYRMSDPNMPPENPAPGHHAREEGYLEPVKVRMDYDGAQGEPLSMIEGSIVDTDYLSEYCKNQMPINVEKYKIPHESMEHLTPFLPGKCLEPEYAEPELVKSTGKPSEAGAKPRKTASEEKLVNMATEGTLKPRRSKYISNGSLHRNGMNDLNKEENANASTSSNESMYLSTPNIKFQRDGYSPQFTSAAKTSPSRGLSPLVKDSTLQRSMPLLPGSDIPEEVAVKKLKKALAANDDGLIALYQGKAIVKRLSSQTELAMKAHRFRLTSSDC